MREALGAAYTQSLHCLPTPLGKINSSRFLPSRLGEDPPPPPPASFVTTSPPAASLQPPGPPCCSQPSLCFVCSCTPRTSARGREPAGVPREAHSSGLALARTGSCCHCHQLCVWPGHINTPTCDVAFCLEAEGGSSRTCSEGPVRMT